MNFEEAVKQINSKESDREDPAIDATLEALEELGRPDKSYDTVLVGGTNGKGSVVEMVSSMLSSQGYRVGVNKSPHLVTIRERIRIGGEMVSRDEFVELYSEVESLDIDLSRFEILTVMAFLYFRKKEVNYAIMEVGMGGRLDATNAAENIGAVITNIGMDHSRYLGDTREKIAAEKAGIVPENGWVVTSEDYEVIKTKARRRGSEVLKPFRVEKKDGDQVFRGQRFQLPVKGGFQSENLEVALKTVEAVDRLPEDIGDALKKMECSGRMEVIDTQPQYIHDGAHNPDALEKIVDEIPEGTRCVFSAVEHKYIGKMVEILEEKVEKFYFTAPDFFLAEDPETISSHASKPFELFQDPAEAVSKALEDTPLSGTVIVTGSLYLIGEVKQKRSE